MIRAHIPGISMAMQWTGTNIEELKEFACDSLTYCGTAWNVERRHQIIAEIETVGGKQFLHIGDYIIKNSLGKFHICKPDIFEDTYILYGQECVRR